MKEIDKKRALHRKLVEEQERGIREEREQHEWYVWLFLEYSSVLPLSRFDSSFCIFSSALPKDAVRMSIFRNWSSNSSLL